MFINFAFNCFRRYRILNYVWLNHKLNLHSSKILHKICGKFFASNMKLTLQPQRKNDNAMRLKLIKCVDKQRILKYSLRLELKIGILFFTDWSKLYLQGCHQCFLKILKHAILWHVKYLQKLIVCLTFRHTMSFCMPLLILFIVKVINSCFNDHWRPPPYPLHHVSLLPPGWGPSGSEINSEILWSQMRIYVRCKSVKDTDIDCWIVKSKSKSLSQRTQKSNRVFPKKKKMVSDLGFTL